MRLGSLFTGIGGFDLAFERAGFELAWQVEIDEHCRRVLERHWPEVRRHRDVRHVHDERAARCPGCLSAVDVLAGGFPCQDVSVAGRRAGLAGERSGLWFEFHRLAAHLRPRWVVIENVPGLLSSNGGRDFGVIVRGLVELGYGVAWRVLDAQYFGVAQQRRRVFVVGCLGDPARAAQVLFEPESCGGNPPPRREAPQDAAGSLGSQPSGGGWRDDTDRMSFVVDMQNAASADSIGTLQGEAMARQNRGYAVARPLLSHHRRIDLESETFVPAITPCLPAYGGARGTTNNPQFDDHALVARSLRARHNTAHRDDADTLVAHSLRAEGADASEDGTGRGTPLVAVAEPLDASYAKTTDSAGSNGAGPRNVVTAAMSVRRLTPTECERLQGFPDGWTDQLSDSARYRSLGNAVAVPVVEWIARRLAHVEVHGRR